MFRTIVTMGARSARLLGTELGLPARRVDDALAELRTAGAVTPVLGGGRSGGRGQLWLVRSATEAVANVRARRLRHVNREAQA
ncbi:MAG TPA: LuxR family transcriptional regulator, partial [Pilimelia sp.]|nr:LuxR family transcriptional regulator [Pilimelia sp.]